MWQFLFLDDYTWAQVLDCDNEEVTLNLHWQTNDCWLGLGSPEDGSCGNSYLLCSVYYRWAFTEHLSLAVRFGASRSNSIYNNSSPSQLLVMMQVINLLFESIARGCTGMADCKGY